MALEEKRELDEILIRCNSATNEGQDGVSVKYRVWVEKDGVEMPGTSTTEGPTPADWQTQEVTDRIGTLAADQAAQITGLQEQKEDLQAQIEDLRAQLETDQPVEA